MDYFTRWGGRFSGTGRRLSMLELVDFGSLNAELAAIFWLLMEKRASVLVAAGPSNAGKTTLLNCLLDFLPAEITKVNLDGRFVDFSFTEHSVPDRTYLFASELNYYGFYLWGDEARTAFELLAQGYGFGSSVHARSIREAIGVLYHGLELPMSAIAKLDLIVTIQVARDENNAFGVSRKVDTAGLITDTDSEGISMALIASRNLDNAGLEISSRRELYPAISGRFGIVEEEIEAEIRVRRQILEKLLEQGKTSQEEVRQEILNFYLSRA